MKKFKNLAHLEGYVYEADLKLKVTGDTSKNPGTEFISGTLSIATDDECNNVVPVHFTYVTATTAQGKDNATYGVLKNIIDGKIKTVMADGKENAGFIRVDSAIALNEWYDKEGKLISVKRCEGGFVHTTSQQLLPPVDRRSEFAVDIVINGVTRVEANEERETPERGIIKGAIFDFRGALMPVEFTVLHPKAIDYFESLEAGPKNPVFTEVRGQMVSMTFVRKIVEESAFGDAAVREVKSTTKDFVITWAAPHPYEWDSENTITAAWLGEAVQQREIHKAEIKKRQDDYQASKNSAFTTKATDKKYDF